jgi:hypothetical protein
VHVSERSHRRLVVAWVHVGTPARAHGRGTPSGGRRKDRPLRERRAPKPRAAPHPSSTKRRRLSQPPPSPRATTAAGPLAPSSLGSPNYRRGRGLSVALSRRAAHRCTREPSWRPRSKADHHSRRASRPCPLRSPSPRSSAGSSGHPIHLPLRRRSERSACRSAASLARRDDLSTFDRLVNSPLHRFSAAHYLGPSHPVNR